MNGIANRRDCRCPHGWRIAPIWFGLIVILGVAISAVASPPVVAQVSRPLFERIEDVPTPSPAGAHEPSLTTHEEALYMSWMEQAGDVTMIMMAIRGSAGWSAPRLVHQGADLFVNWADFPGIAVLEDGTIAIHWLRETGSSSFEYQVEIALSVDDGITWSNPIIPHDDRSHVQHGFVSMLSAGRETLAVVWLDGRAYGAAGDKEGATPNAMHLRATTVTRDGLLGRDVSIDLLTCSCCQTGLAATGDGTILAVYRDRTEDEIRDISVARLTGEGWEEPLTVHKDGWELSGCPVDGPAIAADGKYLAVAWFTGANDEAAVKLAFSDDAGRSFRTPFRIDQGNPVGRVDLELLDDGTALVSWVEWIDGNEALFLCRVDRDAGCTAHQHVATNSAGASVNFPRMARLGQDLFVAWTQPNATGDSIALRRMVLTEFE